MVDRIKITQLVDLDLKSGKVDTSALDREFPKLLQNAFAKLPGAKAILSPDVELKPKFDTKSTIRQLNKLLDLSKTGLTKDEQSLYKKTEGYQNLEKAVNKYTSALEHLNQVSTNEKFTSNFLKKAEQISKGLLPASAVDPKTLQRYREYLSQLQQIFKQIQREYNNIYDSVGNSELKNAAKRLRYNEGRLAEVKAALTQKDLPQAEFDKLRQKETLYQDKVDKELSTKAKLEEDGANRRIIGASVTAEFSQISRSIGDLARGIDKAFNDEKRQEAKQRQDTTTLTEARQKVERLAPTATNREELRRQLSSFTQAQLEELRSAVVAERNKLKAQAGTEELDRERYAHLLNLQRDVNRRLRELNQAEDKALRAARRSENPAVQRGREYFNAAGQDPHRVEPIYRRDAIAYVQNQVETGQLELDRLTKQFGAYSPEVRKAQQELDKFRNAQALLNEEIRHSHPLLHQAGLLLAQFLRYAVGYGALYKLTQGFRDLAAAAVNLQDDLKGIQAITGTTSQEIDGLKEVIEQVATTSAFKIDDIAASVRTLVQAGIELNKIPQAVKAVSDLATASGTTLQTAADIVTTAQAVWEKVSPQEIADKVTQAANVSKLAVEDLQTIFNYGASFAENANISLDQYLNAVSVLRNSGRRPSTIGTGLSQLFKELFSPDDKFADFLSRRYLRNGERVSNRQARERFASFTDTADPLQSALQELIRIGANSSEALIELRRALDQRSVRALQPLLNNPNALNEIAARGAAAPTAAEAAAVAMESLKKASQNLADQLEVLADKAVNPLIGPLTKVVNALSNLADFIGKVVDEGGKNSGEGGGVSVLAGGLAGAAAANRATAGKLKIATVPLGFAAGALGGYGTDRALAAGDLPDSVRYILDGVLAVVIGGWFSRVKTIVTQTAGSVAAASAATAGKSAVTRIAEGATLLLTTATGTVISWFKRVGAAAAARLLPVAGVSLGPVIGAIAVIAGVIFSLSQFFTKTSKAVKDAGIDKFFSAQNATELATQRSERDIKASQAPTRYAQSFPDQPAPDSSLLGAVEAKSREIGLFKGSLRAGLGIPKEQAINLEQAVKLSQEASNFQGPEEGRQVLLKQIQNILGGRGAINQIAIKEAQGLATTIVTGISALADRLANDYTALLRKEAEGVLTEAEQTELSVFKKLRKDNQDFANILDLNKAGGPREIIPTLSAISDLSKQGRAAGLETPESTSRIARYNIYGALDLASRSTGAERDTNLRELQVILRNEVSNQSAGFVANLAGIFTGILKDSGSSDELKSVVSEVIDIVIQGLQNKIDQRKKDLERIGDQVTGLKDVKQEITVANKFGATTTLTGQEFQTSLTATLPSAIDRLEKASQVLAGILQVQSPTDKIQQYNQFTGSDLGTIFPEVGGQQLSNLQNFLDLIATSEGARYDSIVGGKQKITDFSKHPRIVGAVTKDGPSTAAGRYQITASTYDDIAPKLGVTQFQPIDQDRIAIEIFKQAKAYEDILRGDFLAAVDKLGSRFASLPSSPYKQPKRSREFITSVIENQKKGSVVAQLDTGVLETDQQGNLQLNNTLQQQANIVAKKNEPLTPDQINKQLAPVDKRVQELTQEITTLQDSLQYDSEILADQVNQQKLNRIEIAKNELAKQQAEQKRLRVLLFPHETKETELPQDQQLLEDQRKERRLIAEQQGVTNQFTQQNYQTRLDRITSGQDFLLSQNTSEEALRNNRGDAEARKLLYQLEEFRSRSLAQLEKEIQASIAESEKLAKEYADRGQAGRELFEAQVSTTGKLRAQLQATQKAIAASSQQLINFNQQDVQLAKQEYDARYQQLAQLRATLASYGKINEFSGNIAEVEQQILKATEAILNQQVTSGAITRELAELQLERLRASQQQAETNAFLQDIQANVSAVESGREAFSSAELQSQVYRQAIGQSLTPQELSRQATVAQNTYQNQAGLVELRLSDLYDQRTKLRATGNTQGAEFQGVQESIIRLESQFIDLTKRVGEAAAIFEDVNPTFATELNQVSAGSIATQLRQLPQGPANINRNIERRIVDAIDQLGDVLFEGFKNLVGSIFGLTDAVDRFSQERRDLGDAKLAYEDVVQRGVDTARQIEDIKRNESDPARQEYLIKRALEAQKRAEAEASARVADAQANLDKAKQDQSFTGQLRDVGANLFGGLAQDLFKGGFLNLFSNIFGGLGQLGTESNPMVVKVKDGIPGLGGSGDTSVIDKVAEVASGADNGGSVSTTSGGVSGFFSGVGNFFGDLVKDSGLGDIIYGIGDLFGNIGSQISSLVSGIGSAVSSIFSALSSSGGGSAGGDSTGSAIGGIVGAIANIVSLFLADGGDVSEKAKGFIISKGTSRSDSHRAYLSNGEYVLNAKATSAIGKETLDLWNHHSKYPMKFADGGYVGSTRQAVRNRETLREDVANIKPANGPSSLKAILVDDQRRIADYINSPEGEKTLIAFVGRNRLPLRQNLQG